MDNHKAARTNDTKELNQVQLLLLARAKLVDNSGDDSGMVGWLEGLGLPALLSTVDAGPVRHHGLTGCPRVLPSKPLTRWRPEQDVSCGCSPAKSLSGGWPEGWRAPRDPARVKGERHAEKDKDHLTRRRKFRPPGRHCQRFGCRNLQSRDEITIALRLARSSGLYHF